MLSKIILAVLLLILGVAFVLLIGFLLQLTFVDFNDLDEGCEYTDYSEEEKK